MMNFLYLYEYGILKPVEAILRRGRGKNNGEDEPNQGMLYAYMEMLQQNFLYSYYILIKMFKTKLMGIMIQKYLLNWLP
jgi:hypothetical protein